MPGGLASTRARWLAGAAAGIAYAAASHALMTRAQDSAWALAIVLGPIVVLGVAGIWGSGHRLLAAIGLLAALLLALDAAGGHGLSARWLYLAQHAGVHLVLAAWFGSTLRGGAEPLISSLAGRLQGPLTPAMARYTRRLTLAWTLYFLAVVAASLVLFFAGDFAHWSLFANILTPVFTGAFFVGEYLVRYRLHPEFERVSLQQAIHAWRSRGRAASHDASLP
jgi:uncharacterized membrane protein